jgi:hypothetical protein
MALVLIYASQAGHKVVDRGAKIRQAAASFGGGGGLSGGGSLGRGSEVWRQQRGLEGAVRSGGGSKVWKRQQNLGI